jgi:hypothetical protein
MLASAACSGPDQADYVAVVFDPCELSLAPLGASAGELDSIRDAAVMWNATGAAALGVNVENDSELLIRFETAAPLFFGLYRDASARW